MLVVMAEKKIGARSLRPSSPVPRERAALTGLQDAARGQEHSNGLKCAALEAASRAFRRAHGLFHFGKHDRLTSTEYGLDPSSESSLR